MHVLNDDPLTKNLSAFIIAFKHGLSFTAQKMEFSIKVFFSKCDQIRSFLQIWSHLLKKSLWKTSFFVQCLAGLKVGKPFKMLRKIYVNLLESASERLTSWELS